MDYNQGGIAIFISDKLKAKTSQVKRQGRNKSRGKGESEKL